MLKYYTVYSTVGICLLNRGGIVRKFNTFTVFCAPATPCIGREFYIPQQCMKKEKKSCQCVFRIR